MELFYTSRLFKAVGQYRHLMVQLANVLRLQTDKNHDAVCQKFMQAVDDYEQQEINDMVRDAMENYLHTNDIITGMVDYCRKFGIDMDIFRMGEDERICFIADHSDVIMQKLNEMDV